MTYATTCRLCGVEWTFHDDDREEPLICDNCQGEWQQTKIINEIMDGTYKPTGTELLPEGSTAEPETTEDETEAEEEDDEDEEFGEDGYLPPPEPFEDPEEEDTEEEER